MNISATVCEYNPYHNGHKYLTDYAGQCGADYFVGIMSGNVVQRGEFAIMDKYLRAQAAVTGGVDIIIELPCVYTLSEAERFAYGAVKTLDMCGCIDKLYFGAECDDIELLKKTAEYVSGIKVKDYIKSLSENGYSHPRAMYNAVNDIYGKEYAQILSMPNNTLAIEYIKALRDISSKIEPIAVKRKAVGHDDCTVKGEFASASFIRQAILSGDSSYQYYVPHAVSKIVDESIKTGECPACTGNNERGFLQALRRMSTEEWSNIPGVNEGLENRIYKAVRERQSFDKIMEGIKCKRYTYSRIRRTLMCAYLGITKKRLMTEPQYIRVLAANMRGINVLREITKKSLLPVIMSPARDINKISGEGKKLFELECKVSDMYTLFTPSITPCGKDYTRSARPV